MTILFSDVRSYSTISEKLQPAQVVELLNEYFGAMSAVIDAQGGCIVEFLGDAILAVFGAPGDLPDHAERGLRAALQMRDRGIELNRAWEASGKARLWQERGITALASRIGLHTGRVVAGNLGSNEEVRVRLSPELAARARDHGTHAVKGRDHAVHVFTIALEADARAA